MASLSLSATIPYTFEDKYNSLKKPSYEEPDNGKSLDLDYTLESERLKSFTAWTSPVVQPEVLAKAGFYHLRRTDVSDMVKCAFCNAEICNWEPGDDPFEEHIKWCPNCPFARKHPNCLRFVRSDSEEGQDVCGNAEILPNSLPENETFQLLNNMLKNYSDDKARLESFATWPKSSNQNPKALAAAGFYYRGVEDHTICFNCGGALKDWKPEDDPWEQHAMWFPNCKYLISKKGKEYIEDVQNKFKTEQTKEAEDSNSASSSELPREAEVLMCKICDSNERNAIILPCKHIVACMQCASKMDKCPLCRMKLETYMKVYLA